VIKFIMTTALCLAAGAASATMAEHAARGSVDGIDVVAYHTDVKDVVEIIGALPAGTAFAGSTADAAIPTLTGMMLDRGTRTLDKFAIARQLEEVGAEISFNVGTQSMQFQARCLKKDLALVIGLIAAELRMPALSPQEFLKAKQQLIGNLTASLQSTDARAREAYARAVYPEGHPNRPHSTEEVLASVKAAQLKDVKAFHEKYYGPAHLTIVLVGDVTMPLAEAETHKAFAGWSGGQDFLHASPPPAGAGSELKVPLAEKPSVSVLLGQRSGLRYKDPDALALRVGTAILGYGFSGRLMSIVRDKEGLTYGIGAGMGEDNLTDGIWTLSATFAPSLLDKGIASSRRELLRWWTDGVTDKELDERKQGLIGTYYVGLATSAGLAGAIMSALQRGYDLGWLDAYPEAVKALTRDQVNAAIKKRLDPNTMFLVEAGSLPAAAATPGKAPGGT
jgi:zinc protease